MSIDRPEYLKDPGTFRAYMRHCFPYLERMHAEYAAGLPTTGFAGPVPYEKQGGGRWITIGGRPGEDGKRHGGSPVYVEHGRVTKGHPSLAGRKIDALAEEPEEQSHRKALHQSKGYDRAVWGKKARQEGLSPAHLHQFAAELLAHDRAAVEEQKAVLQEARAIARNQGYTNLDTVKARAAHGDLDFTQLKGFDQIAEHIRARHPHLFSDRRHSEDSLLDLLVRGNPEPMAEDDAYAQAFDHLVANKPEEEMVPFEAAAGRAPCLLKQPLS